jgi:hypothetical protein
MWCWHNSEELGEWVRRKVSILYANIFWNKCIENKSWTKWPFLKYRLHCLIQATWEQWCILNIASLVHMYLFLYFFIIFQLHNLHLSRNNLQMPLPMHLICAICLKCWLGYWSFRYFFLVLYFSAWMVP